MMSGVEAREEVGRGPQAVLGVVIVSAVTEDDCVVWTGCKRKRQMRPLIPSETILDK